MFLLTGVLFGVGGVFCIWHCLICKFSSIVLIVSISFGVPNLLCWWWIQSMCIANGSIRGLLRF